MKNWKKVAIAIAVAGMIVGCNSVDKEKLADLTANKSFSQILEAYSVSIYNDNPDAEVYEYWLKENGKKEKPSFDFELVEMKVKKAKAQIDTEIEKKIAALPKMRYQDLKMLRTQCAFMSLSLKSYKRLFEETNKEIKKRLAEK